MSAGELPRGVEQVLVAPTRDLGDDFNVRRALPAPGRRMVGPFVFLDQMGPLLLRGGRALDVRPHPHIGLATVTYLYAGEILHRDSLGSVQPVRPGEVNWMTAGSGIVHSERTPPALRANGVESPLSGLQTWVALPRQHEEAAPTFVHHAAGALPDLGEPGVRLRVILGQIAGARSPVATLSEMFYVDLALDGGARFELGAEHEERAAYVADGELDIEGDRFAPGSLAVLRPGDAVTLRGGAGGARIMLLGGARHDGPRHVWWNFVSSSTERIEEAKRQWREGRFAAVPGETERIPLPDDPPPPVRYP